MSGSKDVHTRVTGDSSGAEHAFKTAGEAAEHFGHAMHALEGAFAFDQIKDAFAEIIHASDEATIAENRFVGAMRTTGKDADPDKFFEMAEGLERTTIFSKEATVNAGAMFGRFKMGQSDIERVIPSLQDFAAFMGRDLVQSADAMSRAVATGGEGLRGLGLGFSAAEKKAFELGSEHERIGLIMNKVKGFSDGFAHSMTQTATGAMQQLHNAIEDTQKDLGGIINAPIAAAFQKVTAAVRELQGWIEHLGPDARDTMAAFAMGIGTAGSFAAGLAVLAGGLGLISTFLPTLMAGFAAIGGILASFILPVIAIGAAFVGLHAIWKTNLGSMGMALRQWVRDVKTFFGDAVDYIKKTFGKVVEWISDKLIVAYGFYSGKSAEETGAILSQSHDQKGGMFGDAGKSLEISGKYIGGEMRSAGHDLMKFLKGASSDMKAMFKSTFGLDVDKLLKGMAGKKAHHGAMDGTGGDRPDFSFKEMFTAARSAKDKAQDTSTGNAMMGGLGEGATHQVGEFLVGIATMGKMTDEAVGNLATAFAKAGMEGADIRMAMRDTAKEMAAMPAALAQGTANALGYWQTAEGQLDLLGATISGAMKIFGAELQSKLGDVGNMISSATKGFEAGGPMGAIAAVAADLLQSSSSFKALVSIANGMVKALAQALNPLVNSMAPILATAGQLMAVIGNTLAGVFQSLQPVFAVVGLVVQILGNVLAPILGILGSVLKGFGGALGMVFKLLGPPLKAVASLTGALLPILTSLGQVFNMTGLVMNLLKPVFEGLHIGLTWLAKQLVNFALWLGKGWNGIVEALAGVVRKIASWLPDDLGGDKLREFADDIGGSAIDLGGLRKTLKDLDNTTLDTEGQFGALSDPLADAAKGMGDLASETSNVPTGFKVALAEYNATALDTTRAGVDSYYSGGGTPSGGGSAIAQINAGVAAGVAGTDNSNNVNITQLTVNGDGANLVADKIQDLLRRRNFVLTGSSEAPPTPNSTPRTGGG